MTPQKLVVLIGIAAMFFFPGARAEDYAGTYHAQDEDGAVQLNLHAASATRYQGELIFDGYPADVIAAVRGNELVGEMNEGDGERYTFTAQLANGDLVMRFDDGESIRLRPGPLPQAAQSGSPNTGSWANPQQGVQQTQGPQVMVNGQALTQVQLQQLANYGIQVQSGSYWYDTVCGAWGAWGGPTAGFVSAGISAPPLPAHASNGNTGVFVNGRNLRTSELNYLMALAGGPIYPGRYWLDSRGNAGFEGGPALINYLDAARQGVGVDAWYGKGSSGWTGSDGSGGIWIANPYGGTGTTVTW